MNDTYAWMTIVPELLIHIKYIIFNGLYLRLKTDQMHTRHKTATNLKRRLREYRVCMRGSKTANNLRRATILVKTKDCRLMPGVHPALENWQVSKATTEF